MKLIIDIPNITYNEILKRKQLAICNDNDIYEWIKNGIPLPKGHGRLIDVSEYYDGSFNDAREFLDNATIIIEADKIESEERKNG